MCSTMENNRLEMTADLCHEKLVAFLQTCEAEGPAEPQPRLCAPPTAQGPESTWQAPYGQGNRDQFYTPQAQCRAKEPIQTQASALCPLPAGPQFPESLVPGHQDSPQEPTEDKDPALDQLLEELMEMPSWHQSMSCYAQSNPTAAYQVTRDSDMPTTFSGDLTLPGDPSMVSRDAQTLPMGTSLISGGDRTPNGSQTPFMLAQIQQGHQRAFTGSQIMNGNQMPFSWEQSLNHQVTYADAKILRSQIALTLAQLGGWSQALSNRDQKQSGSQMVFSGRQTLNTSQMPLSENHSLHRNSMPLATQCPSLYGSQDPFRGDQAINGNQMLFSRDQTHYGGQTTPITGLQTMNFISDQTVTGSQSLIRSDNHSHYGTQRVQQEVSLLQPRYLDSSAHMAQGPFLEPPKPKKPQKRRSKRNAYDVKYYKCTFQGCEKAYYKSFHLRIHERLHTGDKPYVCDVEGCVWKFPRSDELNRHKRKHTGERPYLCVECGKNFARSDHLKQHAKLHR